MAPVCEFFKLTPYKTSPLEQAPATQKYLLTCPVLKIYRLVLWLRYNRPAKARIHFATSMSVTDIVDKKLRCHRHFCCRLSHWDGIYFDAVFSTMHHLEISSYCKQAPAGRRPSSRRPRPWETRRPVLRRPNRNSKASLQFLDKEKSCRSKLAYYCDFSNI